MTITASLVKELRDRTGAGMMDCKKALNETKGDIENAIILIRKSGQAKAANKSNRIAAEGVVAFKIADDKNSLEKKAVIVEVNCETDFVARSSSFLDFANEVAVSCLNSFTQNITDLSEIILENNKTIKESCNELVGKIGENIVVRRIKKLSTLGGFGSYLHNNNRIGVIVDLSADNKELGKDIAMHIAASKPKVILPQQFPQYLFEKEKEIVLAQAQSSGKSPEVLEKMVFGRMKKFVDELSLVKQPFVKDQAITIGDMLDNNQMKVINFIRFEVGEEIG